MQQAIKKLIQAIENNTCTENIYGYPNSVLNIQHISEELENVKRYIKGE